MLFINYIIHECNLQFLSVIYLCIYICNHKYFYLQLDTLFVNYIRILLTFFSFCKKKNCYFIQLQSDESLFV